MEERSLFVADVLRGDLSISELCRRYAVSRKTGYKWLARYEEDGIRGLADRSHAAHECPHRVSERVREKVLAVRIAHPTWGPLKVRAWLMARDSSLAWPATSTIGDMFKGAGLTQTRKRRRHAAWSSPLADCDETNKVWSVDFKGWFRTGDGARCDPLTLQDAHSRYLLRCQAVERTDSGSVWPIFDAAFRTYGLPLRMRSDNGAPFASLAVGGLSRLAVKLIKAGVTPERIAPGKPQQNGRHERFHLTLKRETASPPAANLRRQQRAFDAFARIYNEERPHAALGQTPPGQHYVRSPRRYSGRLREPEYASDFAVRRVRGSGEIKWRGTQIFLSEVLSGEPVGCEELEGGGWRVHYGPLALGVIDQQSRFVRCSPAHEGLRASHPNLRG